MEGLLARPEIGICTDYCEFGAPKRTAAPISRLFSEVMVWRRVVPRSVSAGGLRASEGQQLNSKHSACCAWDAIAQLWRELHHTRLSAKQWSLHGTASDAGRLQSLFALS